MVSNFDHTIGWRWALFNLWLDPTFWPVYFSSHEEKLKGGDSPIRERKQKILEVENYQLLLPFYSFQFEKRFFTGKFLLNFEMAGEDSKL